MANEVTGFVQIMHLPVLLNQEVIIMQNFTLKGMLDAVVKYRSSELWLVPRKFPLTYRNP
jgi:4-coumarate--CoA ligase